MREVPLHLDNQSLTTNGSRGWGVRTSVSFLTERAVKKRTQILVEQQPPQGVFVCDHAGLVINKFSLGWEGTIMTGSLKAAERSSGLSTDERNLSAFSATASSRDASSCRVAG